MYIKRYFNFINESNSIVTSKVTLQKKFADIYNIIYNNEIIGTINIPSDLESDTISISDLNIKPKFRGKGLVVEIYKAAMQIAGKPLESFMATDEANRGWNSLIKQGLAKKTETGFISINNQITPQQKQQALQLYSSYLDTIFPDSKVKDIVYHGYKLIKDDLKIEKFDKSKAPKGFYFTTDKDYANSFTKKYTNVKESGIISAVLNLTNPKQKKDLFRTNPKIATIENKDGFIGNDMGFEKENVVVVFEPEQVHILGSKNDIEGFKEFASTQQPTTYIKKGVEELFDSNSELAQSVYEALGFKIKPDVILPIGTSGSGKSTFIKSLPQENLVVIEPDAMRVEFTGDINNKSKDKEIYEEAAKRAIAAIKKGKQVVFDTTNLTKDKRLPFIEAIKKEIPTANIQYKLMELNPELAKKRIKAQIERGENRANVPDSTIDRHAESYKQMFEDIQSEPISNYEITSQQKQQALQLYSQYLDTVFPDSEVKDIVYHGTDKEFDKFKKPSELGSQNRMIAFADDIEYAKIAGSRRTPLKKVISALVNITKIYPVDKLEAMELDSGYRDEVLKGIREEDKVDGLVFESDDDLAKNNFTEILVFEPEQIHILGSQKDIQGFKEFASAQQQPTTYIKKGVEELFDENPELAKSVYEAL